MARRDPTHVAAFSRACGSATTMENVGAEDVPETTSSIKPPRPQPLGWPEPVALSAAVMLSATKMTLSQVVQRIVT